MKLSYENSFLEFDTDQEPKEEKKLQRIFFLFKLSQDLKLFIYKTLPWQGYLKQRA